MYASVTINMDARRDTHIYKETHFMFCTAWNTAFKCTTLAYYHNLFDLVRKAKVGLWEMSGYVLLICCCKAV